MTRFSLRHASPILCLRPLLGVLPKPPVEPEDIDLKQLYRKSDLASTLMQAYESNNDTYSEYLDKIDRLLQKVAEKVEHFGTDFDKEYTKGLEGKFKAYLS